MTEVVIRPPSDRTWRLSGLCHVMGIDTEVFYVDADAEPTTVERLRGICWRCPSQAECLDHALAYSERHGMWGGATEAERRRLARQVHGTAERYQHRRCRCVPCSLAYARKRAAGRELERLMTAVVEALSDLDVDSPPQRMVG